MNEPELPRDEPGVDSPPPGAEIDLARVHGSILRENHEPVEGYHGVPLWFVMLIMALVFWGGLYLANNSGGFRANVFDPVPPGTTQEPLDPAKLGQRVYARNCVLCHQVSGLGVGLQYPPLAGSEWVLAEDWRGDNHLVAIVLHGMEGPVSVRGRMYNGAMAPWKALRDDEIAAVLNYIRSAWGNSAPAIGPDFVRRVREQTQDRVKPWLASDLRALPAERVVGQ